MIVGKGLIASLFKDDDQQNTIFFASGVSNSSETDIFQFQREENLILNTINNNLQKLFIYFSTCSMYDSSKLNSAYVLHKHRMEELIMSKMENYLILRVSNAVGNGGNPNLLMNYLVENLKAQQPITIHQYATRNLIDVEDIKNLTLELIHQKRYNRIINIAYPQNYTIVELVNIIEEYYHLKTTHQIVNTGSGYEISIPETEEYFIKNNLLSKEVYIRDILKKYY